MQSLYRTVSVGGWHGLRTRLPIVPQSSRLWAMPVVWRGPPRWRRTVTETTAASEHAQRLKAVVGGDVFIGGLHERPSPLRTGIAQSGEACGTRIQELPFAIAVSQIRKSCHLPTRPVPSPVPTGPRLYRRCARHATRTARQGPSDLQAISFRHNHENDGDRRRAPRQFRNHGQWRPASSSLHHQYLLRIRHQ